MNPAKSCLDLGVGDPGSSNIGGLSGLEDTPPLKFLVGVTGPLRGLTSRADINRTEAEVVPGDAGVAASADGISSHSLRATVLCTRKKGHISVNIFSEVTASA